jgi:2-(1,2-epoxy-1,2-dihydrophenyl)acetyl-CoA isomerase
MADETVLVRDGDVATITLNRPASLNALSADMMTEFLDHLGSVAADETLRAVIVTGTGKAFCAGGDLKLAVAAPGGVPAAFGDLAPKFHESIVSIRRMAKPVIAAVNGVAAGGGFSLALACDFRVMARNAVLMQAYTSSGLCLDGGGTFSLPRLVGLAKALEICAFDEPIHSDRALELGLVTKVVDDDVLLDETCAMARDLASRSVNSFGWAKQLLVDSFETRLETQLCREVEAITTCAAHLDGQEGVRAFMEKRPPDFRKAPAE